MAMHAIDAVVATGGFATAIDDFVAGKNGLENGVEFGFGDVAFERGIILVFVEEFMYTERQRFLGGVLGGEFFAKSSDTIVGALFAGLNKTEYGLLDTPDHFGKLGIDVGKIFFDELFGSLIFPGYMVE